MSVQHFVDRPHRLVVSMFSGQVTLDQIAAACTKLRHNHDFQPTYRQLADLSAVSQLSLHPEDINTIRMTYDPFSHQSRRAFVAPDSDTFGTVTAYGSAVESPEFGVFPSMLDALSWLDLEVTVLDGTRIRSTFRNQFAEGLTFDLLGGASRTFRTIPAPAKKSQPGSH